MPTKSSWTIVTVSDQRVITYNPLHKAIHLESLWSLSHGPESGAVISYQAPCKFFKTKYNYSLKKQKNTLKALHLIPSDSTLKTTETSFMFYTTASKLETGCWKKDICLHYPRTAKYSEVRYGTGSNQFYKLLSLKNIKND